MIIIEGCDGSGKSTLAWQLSRALNMPVARKVVDSDTRPMVDLRQWTDDNLAKGFHRAIYDRHRLISEPIYSAVLNNREVDERFWDPRWFQESMTKLVVHIQPVVVYCMPPFPHVWANVRDDVQNVVVRQHVQQLYNAYLNRMALDPQALSFDYTAQDVDVRFDQLVDSILLRCDMKAKHHDRRSH